MGKGDCSVIYRENLDDRVARREREEPQRVALRGSLVAILRQRARQLRTDKRYRRARYRKLYAIALTMHRPVRCGGLDYPFREELAAK
jgi:hypothetical protein